MKKHEEQRFEFIMKINPNEERPEKGIICQRFFNIRGYDKNILKDNYLIKELLDDNVRLIQDDLKEKSIEYLWKYYKPYVPQKPEDVRIKKVEKDDTYQFEIRVDKRTVAKKRFSATDYPPKVRYDVNIRHLVQSIISDIQYTLSKKIIED